MGATTAKSFTITLAVSIVAVFIDFSTHGELFGWLALLLVGACLFGGAVSLAKGHSRRFGMGLILGAGCTLLVYLGFVAWALSSGLLAG
jgi:hypothetical protein